MPEPIDELAIRSRNFGFLLRYEPLLVMDGAAAESYLYSDPDAAMAKARRFTETLAKLLVTRTQTRVSGSTHDARIRALTDAGVLVPRIRQAFDDVRNAGNRAVHSHWGDVRAALSCVRTCFELGVWFHRAVTGEPFLQGFVPPPDPAAQAQATSTERAELEELSRDLARQRAQLAEVKAHQDGQTSRLEAEARARRQAEAELARTVDDREDLRSLVEQTQQRLAEVEARFEAEMGRAQRVRAVQRDAFIARAQQAAVEPLTEADVRERVDEMLRRVGWDLQDANTPNLFAADGVAVREVATAGGVADYLLYVDRKLAGLIEAKREGTILSPVEVQSSRYAGSLTASQQCAAWRIPLPFRYETTAVETHFTNTLDPEPRARRVFSFHQPQTLAGWMREADDDPGSPTLRALLQARRASQSEVDAEHPEPSQVTPLPRTVPTPPIPRYAVTPPGPGHPAGLSSRTAKSPASESSVPWIFGPSHNLRRNLVTVRPRAGSQFTWRAYAAAFIATAVLAVLIVYIGMRFTERPQYLITTIDQGYKGSVGAIAFSPSGNTLAIARDDGTTLLWNVATNKQETVFGYHHVEGTANIGGAVAFSPNGHTLASGLDTNSGIDLWSIGSDSQIANLNNNVSDAWWGPAGPWGNGPYADVAFSRDGSRVAAASLSIELYSVNKQRMIADLATSNDEHSAHGIGSVAFSPVGSTLAAATVSGVELWDVNSHRLIGYLLLHPGKAWDTSSVAYSPNGRVLAVGSSDGTVWLWDTAKNQMLGALRGSGDFMAFSPNGQTLATFGDSGIELWNVATQARIRTLASSGCPASLAFSSNGRILAQASCTGGAVNLWNVGPG